jgi:predicted RNA-binding protein with RPS1 domain
LARITTSYKGKWNELGKELENIIMKNNELPKEERKVLSKVFEEFAEKHDTTSSSASYYYYNEIKNKIEEKPKLNIDESIGEHVNSNIKDPRSIYKNGDVLEVEITSIYDFGAFARTKEGFEGLIHISEITGKEYVEFPEDYFYIGEKVRVKLKRIDFEGKLAFSTRATGGKVKINPAFKDISNPISANKETDYISIEPELEEVENELLEIEIEPFVEEIKSTTHPNDRENIIEFIKKYSDNNMSKQALADIDEMISRYGVFQTTVSLMESVRDLDISAFITNITKEKLVGECLRRS